MLCESLLARKLSCLLLQPSNHHHRSSFSTRLLSRAFLLIPLVRVSLLSPSHCQLFHLSILHPSQSLRKIFHYKHLPHCFSLISSIASINLHPFHNHYPAPSDHWALHSVAASCHFGACYLPTLKLQSTTLLPYYHHQSGMLFAFLQVTAQLLSFTTPSVSPLLFHIGSKQHLPLPI